ncbi:hypothetical protein SDC9_209643 [bioreactor metagenome]|uniref:Uncharacterized protein n=1 Tax=bioreactor metagenome TaxID=1076179 RepID=A0A645JEV9_9ZZZZ
MYFGQFIGIIVDEVFHYSYYSAFLYFIVEENIFDHVLRFEWVVRLDPDLVEYLVGFVERQQPPFFIFEQVIFSVIIKFPVGIIQ